MDGDFLDQPRVYAAIPWPALAAKESMARRQALRHLIAEAERACRFMEGLGEENARYRARELRAEIAAALLP